MTSMWHRLIWPHQRRFRRERAARILERFPEIANANVIDVGGSLTFWREVEDILRPKQVICYNISEARMNMGSEPSEGRIVTRLYDGTRLPEADNAAEIVLCNSVIEHVPVGARANLASEIMRVGQSYVVQTPSPSFPLELHFGLPFIHWLPRSLGRPLSRVSPFHLLAGVNGPKYFDETQLLPKKEFLAYFPGGALEVEWAFGFPKSYLLFGGRAAHKAA